MAEGDDDSLSEITILPDGRVYVFGMTRPLLEALSSLPSREGHPQALLAHLHAATSSIDQENSRE